MLNELANINPGAPFIFRSCLPNALLLTCWLLCGANSCGKNEELITVPKRSSFSGGFSAGTVTAPALTEVSGIAGGISNPGLIWAHNDSGDEARIFALTGKGEHKATYYLQDVRAIDWEDIAAGPGPVPGRNYLYVADIGDNLARRSCVVIYRFEEPLLKETGELYRDTIGREYIDVFYLKYEEGPRDAETFMGDPLSGTGYIISKREAGAGLYSIKLPSVPADTLLLQRSGWLSCKRITGGDISPDGSEILLKNYNRLFYWQRPGKATLEEVLERKARRLPYIPEPQGEAIAWKKDGTGFFTLSEEVLGIAAVLYWHKRK